MELEKLDKNAALLTTEQKKVEDLGFSVKWVGPGIEFSSIRYHDHGYADSSGFMDEGIYRLEVVGEDLRKSKWIFIDEHGEIAIPFVYNYAYNFSDGLAFVNLDGRRILIDSTGNEVLPCSYDMVDWSLGGPIWAGNGEKYAMFDSKGNRLTEMEYDYIGQAHCVEPMREHEYLHNNAMDGDGPFIAQKNGKYGLIDKTGKEAVQFEYDFVFGWTEGVFAACKNGKWGHIDSAGETVTHFRYDAAEMFSDGLAKVSVNDKWGYVNRQGNLEIPIEYDYAEYFFNGVAAVAKIADGNINSYVIDKTGKAILGPKNYRLYTWGNTYTGEAYDTNPYSYALLDERGDRLTSFSYSGIQDFNEGFAIVHTNTDNELKWGLVNKYGAETLPLIFSNIEIIDDGKCIVEVSEGDYYQNCRVGILTLPDDAATRKPPLSERPITVYLDGLDLYFDVEPKIIDGRTMVPMRKIFEALGADISWDGNARKVTAVRGSIIVELTIGNDTALVNGKPVKLEALAVIEEGRSLVPLRFVAEALGCRVSWDSEKRRVAIASEWRE